MRFLLFLTFLALLTYTCDAIHIRHMNRGAHGHHRSEMEVATEAEFEALTSFEAELALENKPTANQPSLPQQSSTNVVPPSTVAAANQPPLPQQPSTNGVAPNTQGVVTNTNSTVIATGNTVNTVSTTQTNVGIKTAVASLLTPKKIALLQMKMHTMMTSTGGSNPIKSQSLVPQQTSPQFQRVNTPLNPIQPQSQSTVQGTNTVIENTNTQTNVNGKKKKKKQSTTTTTTATGSAQNNQIPQVQVPQTSAVQPQTPVVQAQIPVVQATNTIKKNL